MINAGAVAKDGIAVKIGANRVESRNRSADTRAVRPVRPPTATPDADSTDTRKTAFLVQHVCLGCYTN